MDKEFEDGDAEVEVKIPLPDDVVGSNAAKNLIVECTPTSLKVLRREGGPPLLEASPLYEKVRPGELSWYIENRQIVITLQKLVNQKWPALTDKEALEKRFGPINVSPVTSRVAEGEKDGAAAFSARGKVDRFLKAAQSGDIEELKQAAEALSEGKESLAETVEGTKDATGRGALHFATHKGRTEVVRFLLEEVKLHVDPRDEQGETPLMLAAREGHLEAARCLLDGGADPKASAESSGAGALHHAAGHGAVELVRLLVERGAEVNAQSDAGPPLLWACGHGHQAAVEALLEMGADPNITNEDGITSLITAAAANETDIVEILVKHGANVHLAAGAGVTPLFVAANEGNLRMLESLLGAGADPDAVDEEGAKPIQAAAAQGHREIVERLLGVTRPLPPSRVREWTVEALLEAAEPPASLSKSEMPFPEATVPSASPGPVSAGGDAEAGNGSGNGSGSGSGSGHGVGPGNGDERDARAAEKMAAAKEAKERADAAFKKKDFMAALDAYTQATDLDPGNATLLSNRSLCWMRLGQAENALDDARAARRLRPDWSKACYREGASLRLLERYEEAATAFYEGVQLEPSNIELAMAFQEAVEAGRKAHKEKTRISEMQEPESETGLDGAI